MAQQGPGDGFEEGVGLDVGGAGAGAEAFEFVFDEEFADYGLAEAGTSTKLGMGFGGGERLGRGMGGKAGERVRGTHFETTAACPSGNGTSSRKIFANVAFRFFPLNGVVPNSIS